jgi:hypothetical protein
MADPRCETCVNFHVVDAGVPAGLVRACRVWAAAIPFVVDYCSRWRLPVYEEVPEAEKGSTHEPA